jgi:hypothetical protein
LSLALTSALAIAKEQQSKGYSDFLFYSYFVFYSYSRKNKTRHKSAKTKIRKDKIRQDTNKTRHQSEKKKK